MKPHRGYLGCIASDEIDKIIDKIQPMTSGSFIMNLDVTTGPGTHWVAVYWTPSSLEYYNPLGNAPTDKFRSDAKKLAKAINPNGFLKLKVNQIQRQSNDTDTCGYHAMKFIIDREKGKSFSDATGYHDHKKDDHVNGEKAVTKFIDHMHGGGFEFISGDGIIDKVNTIFSNCNG